MIKKFLIGFDILAFVVFLISSLAGGHFDTMTFMIFFVLLLGLIGHEVSKKMKKVKEEREHEAALERCKAGEHVFPAVRQKVWDGDARRWTRICDICRNKIPCTDEPPFADVYIFGLSNRDQSEDRAIRLYPFTEEIVAPILSDPDSDKIIDTIPIRFTEVNAVRELEAEVFSLTISEETLAAIREKVVEYETDDFNLTASVLYFPNARSGGNPDAEKEICIGTTPIDLKDFSSGNAEVLDLITHLEFKMVNYSQQYVDKNILNLLKESNIDRNCYVLELQCFCKDER